MDRFQNILLLCLAFSFSFSPAYALKLGDMGEVKGEEKTSSEEETLSGVVVDIPEPVIESVSIEEYQENGGVNISIKGKNFIPTHGTVTVLFPTSSGGSSTISSFIYSSPTHLVFSIPKNAGSGNIYVKAQETKGGKTTKQSKAFYFEFHPPEISFITGDEGIAPGKKIRIWGKNLDGVYYQKGGRNYVVEDVSTGKLSGGFTQKTDEGLSYIDITLPEENFNKKFWVERGCDRDGKNCLKSNEVSLSNSFSPILTEFQMNFQTREVTVYGEFFPEEKKDLSISYDGKTMNATRYSSDDGIFTFQLPCPMPGRGILEVKYKELVSNPLVITAPDVPELFGISVGYSFQSGYRRVEVSARGDLPNVSSSVACPQDAILYLGSTGIPLEKFGGVYFNDNVKDSYISGSGEASVVFRGIRSEKIPYEKESFSTTPYIYRLESKYGFRPGAPFQIIGRNLGNRYKSCGEGTTVFNGPKIYSEEKANDGVCTPLRPSVTDSSIEAQFVSLEYGEYSTKSVSTPVSVTVDGKKSNEITILFGTTEQKVSYSKPVITAIEYPEGHIPGSKIIVRGYNFGTKANQNIISFSGKQFTPKSANIRGTELTFKIPEGASSGNMTVTRRNPNEQISDGVDLFVSPHEKQKIEFSLLESEEKTEEIEVDGGEKSIAFADIAVMNSISDSTVRRMRFDLFYTDGDPEHALSYETLKVLPFRSFTLKYNGKEVSSPVIPESAGDGHFFINFPEFTLPLTEKESDTLTVETTVLPFVTDGSSFSLSFNPGDPSRISLYSEELEEGIGLSSQPEISLSSFVVHQSDAKTCIDTLSDNSHCDQYALLQKKNANWQEKIRQEKQEEKALKKQVVQERQGKDIKTEILEKQRLAAQERVAEILRNKETKVAEKMTSQQGRIETLVEEAERKIARFRKALSSEHAEKAIAVLEKKVEALQLVLEKQKQEENNAREKAFDTKRKEEKTTKLRSIAFQEGLPIAERLRKGARIDTDRDGLSDSEEVLFGTDLNRSDTDHDGYGDFSEVEFGFPPLEREASKIYSDISGSGEALGAISRFALMGLFPEAESSFHPSEKTTRAEFINLLMSVFADTKKFFGQNPPFIDVNADDWFASAVQAAYNTNLINSGTTRFRPLENITRLEACSFVVSVANIPPKPLSKTEKIPFADLSSSDAAIAKVCVQEKLISIEEVDQTAPTEKDPDPEEVFPNFEPRGTVTRAEMALMVYRAIFIAQ